MQVEANFYNLLVAQLLESAYSGFGPDGAWVQKIPEKNAAGQRPFLVPDAAENDVGNFFSHSPHFPGFARAFNMYEDMDSSYLMTLLVAHKIMGPSRVRLPITRASYEDVMRKDVDSLRIQAHTHDANFDGMKLDLYDLSPAGIPLKVHSTRSGVAAHFFLQQYAFRRGDRTVTVEPGDTVIDGGMCFGDTSLLFAHLAGEKGRVVGYEFEEVNLRVMADNLALNPDLAPRITIANNAVWNVSGEEKRFMVAGPATTMLPDGATPANGKRFMLATTLTIDDLVAKEKLDRVDFLKLDVEGAEMAALQGAVNTLRRFKPKLALSAYHRPQDMYALIDFLHSLNLGYHFWLAHFRPNDQETVIFAKCQRPG